MNAKEKKRRIFVIITWFLFLIVISLASLQIEKDICSGKIKEELLDQADIISRQFPKIIENDYYTKIISQKMLLSETKAISFALEKYDSISQAEDFLNEITETVGNKMYICDRNGEILYSNRTDQIALLDKASVNDILNHRAYESIEDSFSYYDVYSQYLHVMDYYPAGRFSIPWGIKDKWLLVIEDSLEKSQAETEEYFEWNNVIQSVKVGRTGSILAISKENGKILSYQDRAREGNSFTNLSIRIGQEKETAALERLLDEFKGPDTVSEIEVNGVRYYATRLNFDYDLLLAMIPVSESTEDAVSKISILLLFAAVISGIGAFYVFFHIGEKQEVQKQSTENKTGRKSLQGAVKLYSILAVILIIILSLYVEALGVYAQTFRYTASKAEDVVEIMNNNTHAMDDLQVWFDQENLAKCNLARCILSDTDQKDLNDSFISHLADCLEVRFLSIFDEEGNILLTNAPSDRATVTKSSPFYVLLEGRSYLIQEPKMNEIAGEVLQVVGVPTLDDQDRTNGCLLIAASTTEMSALADNLDFEDNLQQVCLADETFVMSVRNSDLTIENMTEVRGFSYIPGLNSSDYTGLPVSALEIKEEKIQDDFSGSLSVLKKSYFASIKRTDNHYIFVMRPLIRITGNDIFPILFITIAMMAFVLLLYFVFCRDIDRPEEDPLKTEPEPQEVHSESGDDIAVFWESIINKNKPFFEERWPSDGKKWKDKSPNEKFSSVALFLVILTLLTIVVHALIAGENSIWYYCINGEWERGINIYSITSCIIIICILSMSKLLLHKLLYLLARAVKSKGETICHLLNSFLGYALLIASVFICLGMLGVNATALSLTGGVAGVIFGIGCQNIVADILAGILMTFEGVACVGDLVSFNNKSGIILSIGVRTTRLKSYNEITIIRNNEFKNYVNYPSLENGRVITTLCIDLMESLEHVEQIIEQELPQIHENLCTLIGEYVEVPIYRGVQSIDQNGTTLSFAIFCKGMHYGTTTRMLNRELKLMCERNKIKIAMPQIVINTREDIPGKND